MSLHPNSIAAYDSTATERGTLESRVLDLMADGKPRTDRQIQHDIGWPEALRPRVTTLVENGRLHEVGSTICETTHKRVRLTRRFI